MSSPKRRDQILDVTRSIVDEEGFRAVSLDRIAQDSGVTRTLLYQLFNNLAGLLVALIDRESLKAFEGFQRALLLRPAGQVASLTAAFRGILDAVDADPATWRMFLMPSEGGPPELYERLALARSITRDYLNKAISAAGAKTKAKLLMSEDPDLAIHLIHTTADELVRLRLTDPHTYSKERLIAHAERMARSAGLIPPLTEKEDSVEFVKQQTL